MPEPTEPWIAIQVVMMPRDANPLPTILPGVGQNVLYGTIFGGVILSHIDTAGALAARRELLLRGGNPRASFVTVAINRVEFKKPVLVGDVVRFQTTVVKIGRTSITVHIDVHAERGAETIHVTEAEGVFVGVDLSTPDRKPVPLFPVAEPT
jgi:acyl-CoA thioesterase YciA